MIIIFNFVIISIIIMVTAIITIIHIIIIVIIYITIIISKLFFLISIIIITSFNPLPTTLIKCTGVSKLSCNDYIFNDILLQYHIINLRSSMIEKNILKVLHLCIRHPVYYPAGAGKVCEI